MTSALAVEIPKLPPFEAFSIHTNINLLPPPRGHAPHSSSLPWIHSPIIAAIAASVAEPPHTSPPSPSHVHSPVEDAAAPVQIYDPPTKNAKGPTPAVVAPATTHDDEESDIQPGCIPPKLRNRCIIS